METINDILAALRESELAVSDLYAQGAMTWADQNDFWKGLSKEEIKHAAMIMRMGKIVDKKPDDFLIKNQLNVTAISSFNRVIRENVQKLRDGEWEKDGFVGFCKGVEDSLIEKDFTRIVVTDDAEFVGLMNDIAMQTLRHRISLTHIAEQPTLQAIMRESVVPPDWQVLAAEIRRAHSKINDYMRFMRKIPENKSQFRSLHELTKIQEQVSRYLEEHFYFAETSVYPALMSMSEDQRHSGMISVLYDDHKKVLAEFRNFSAFCNGMILPLSAEKVKVMNERLFAIIDMVQAHIANEGERLLSALLQNQEE